MDWSALSSDIKESRSRLLHDFWLQLRYYVSKMNELPHSRSHRPVCGRRYLFTVSSSGLLYTTTLSELVFPDFVFTFSRKGNICILWPWTLQDLDAKWILQLAKFRQEARAPKNVYIVYQPKRQQTAKHHAKFCWPLLSDVGAVMKQRRETGWNLLGAPNSPTDLSCQWADVHHIVEIHGGGSLFNKFFRLSIHALVANI